MQFKVSIHSGQINTFKFEEAECKEDVLNQYLEAFAGVKASGDLLAFGDLLVNTNLVSFVAVEEVQEVKAPEAEEATVEA